MHAMRTTRLDSILQQLRQVDAAVINTFEACMGLALPCHARKQAALWGFAALSSTQHRRT